MAFFCFPSHLFRLGGRGARFARVHARDFFQTLLIGCSNFGDSVITRFNQTVRQNLNNTIKFLQFLCLAFRGLLLLVRSIYLLNYVLNMVGTLNSAYQYQDDKNQ